MHQMGGFGGNALIQGKKLLTAKYAKELGRTRRRAELKLECASSGIIDSASAFGWRVESSDRNPASVAEIGRWL